MHGLVYDMQFLLLRFSDYLNVVRLFPCVVVKKLLKQTPSQKVYNGLQGY